MTEAERLAEKIEAANGQLELTAEEAVHLSQKVERAEWPFSDRAFQGVCCGCEGVEESIENVRIVLWLFNDLHQTSLREPNI